MPIFGDGHRHCRSGTASAQFQEHEQDFHRGRRKERAHEDRPVVVRLQVLAIETLSPQDHADKKRQEELGLRKRFENIV